MEKIQNNVNENEIGEIKCKAFNGSNHIFLSLIIWFLCCFFQVIWGPIGKLVRRRNFFFTLKKIKTRVPSGYLQWQSTLSIWRHLPTYKKVGHPPKDILKIVFLKQSTKMKRDEIENRKRGNNKDHLHKGVSRK